MNIDKRKWQQVTLIKQKCFVVVDDLLEIYNVYNVPYLNFEFSTVIFVFLFPQSKILTALSFWVSSLQFIRLLNE
jgi:hypothetical protein